MPELEPKLQPDNSDQQPPTEANPLTSNFYELQILQTIPVIINKLKDKEIGAADKKFLKHIFGDLWQLMEDESNRPRTEHINPILGALLHELHLLRQRSKQTNDIEGNTIEKTIQQLHFKANDQIPIRLSKLQVKQVLPLSQRLLRVAAILIHEAFAKRKSGKKLSESDGSGDFEAKRTHRRKRIHKRRLSADDSDSRMKSDDAKRRRRSVDLAAGIDDVDDEVQMNVLRAMINQNEKTNEEYNYDDAEYDYTESGKEKNYVRSVVQPETVERNDYQDYAFDTTNTDPDDEDELLLRRFYGRSSVNDDYEYESISDLMNLAAKHNLRAQRDSGYLKRLHFNDYFDNDFEY